MVDLVLIGEKREINWDGNVYYSKNSIRDINSAIKYSLNHGSQYVLLWMDRWPSPNYNAMQKMLYNPADVLHSGLRLGMGGKPFILNFISPVWMFNKDPDTLKRITSFRMHMFGTLLKKDVFKHLGLFDENFNTLEGAALDMGLRLIKGGAFIIFEPELLLNVKPENTDVKIPLEDEVRMLIKHYSKQQIVWALLRSISYGYPIKKVLAQIQFVLKSSPQKPLIWERKLPSNLNLPEDRTYNVSVVIPTLKRHPYLEKVLNAMRYQTIKPHQVIVIDEDEFPEFYSRFRDLPLIVLTGSNIGQSTARNRGLEKVTGNFIMILDDDIDEIPADFIETHLKYIEHFKTDVSCGTIRERGVDFTVHRFKKFVKAADFFPTNNVLLKREIFDKSGKFDINFNKGMRADHDVGMRIYLEGYLMGVNPFVDVFHHRAPRGGLRENKARKTTFAAARKSILKRNLLHKTAIYLYLKYYELFQVKEALILNVRGTFVAKGNLLKRILKIIVATIQLPHTIYTLNRRYKEALKLIRDNIKKTQ